MSQIIVFLYHFATVYIHLLEK